MPTPVRELPKVDGLTPVLYSDGAIRVSSYEIADFIGCTHNSIEEDLRDYDREYYKATEHHIVRRIDLPDSEKSTNCYMLSERDCLSLGDNLFDDSGFDLAIAWGKMYAALN